MSLSRDIVAEILKRVDGITLAKAACCCSEMRSIADEETLWENLCRSLWPSTGNEEVQSLVSSLGGFKKFYADCFPLINLSEHPAMISSREDYQKFFNRSSVRDDDDDDDDDDTVSLSDFVSVVDIHYNNKAIYSKVAKKIPAADDIMIDSRSSTVFPLVIDLPCDISESALFSISTEEDVEGKLLSGNLRLSWILINRKTKRAVNLSSWRPLEAQNWGYGGNYFTVRFGSILPAHDNGLPLKLAACNIVMRCRVEAMNLQVCWLSMELDDMMGCQVNARDGLVILNRAVDWADRTNNHDQVIQRCHDLLELQCDFMEEKLGGQSRMDPFCILFSLGVAAVSCYYFIL